MLCLSLLLAAMALGLLGGCGPEEDVLDVEMQIYNTRVVAVTATSATLAWTTSIPGDSRVDFSIVAPEATDDAERESISDENYVPLWRGGGVTVNPDPRFQSVSNTVLDQDFVNHHEVTLEDLETGRTYVATVSSTNGQGAQVHEFGARLQFTTR